MKSEHGLNGLRRLTQIKICEIREILLNPCSRLPNKKDQRKISIAGLGLWIPLLFRFEDT